MGCEGDTLVWFSVFSFHVVFTVLNLFFFFFFFFFVCVLCFMSSVEGMF